jgi:hypothetical protein
MVNISNSLILAIIFLNYPNPPQSMELVKGLDILYIPIKNSNVEGIPQILVFRVDPHLWDLVYMGKSFPYENMEMTVREWCNKYDLAAAINVGMFQTDNRTNVGYLKYKDYKNNSQLNNYKSVLAFNPKKDNELPVVKIFDLDDNRISLKGILDGYNAAVQNLRLIKKPGINVWQQQVDKWSEAALGEDNKGNLLFIFYRYPLSMYDLNKRLLESGIGIVAAQHLEGGPEAQLFLKEGDVEFEQFGSYETSYNENEDNNIPVPIPNILGIRRRHN